VIGLVAYEVKWGENPSVAHNCPRIFSRRGALDLAIKALSQYGPTTWAEIWAIAPDNTRKLIRKWVDRRRVLVTI
jgi:hypothetical protein